MRSKCRGGDQWKWIIGCRFQLCKPLKPMKNCGSRRAHKHTWKPFEKWNSNRALDIRPYLSVYTMYIRAWNMSLCAYEIYGQIYSCMCYLYIVNSDSKFCMARAHIYIDMLWYIYMCMWVCAGFCSIVCSKIHKHRVLIWFCMNKFNFQKSYSIWLSCLYYFYLLWWVLCVLSERKLAIVRSSSFDRSMAKKNKRIFFIYILYILYIVQTHSNQLLNNEQRNFNGMQRNKN